MGEIERELASLGAKPDADLAASLGRQSMAAGTFIWAHSLTAGCCSARPYGSPLRPRQRPAGRPA